MKGALSLVLLLLMTGVALADESAEKAAAEDTSAAAREVLEKADAAIKKVSAASFDVKSTPTGVAVNFRNPTEGRVVLSGWSDEMNIPVRMYADVRTERDGAEVRLTGGGNGDTFFIIDHGEKKGYEDMDPGVMGTGAGAIRGVAMLEFVHSAPFDDELGAEQLDLLADEKLGEDECHVVRVVYSGGRGESVWYFSKSDMLPRRRLQKFTVPGQGEGALEINLSNLVINPELDPALFRMKLPAGYEQIDDFAP